MKHSLYIIVLFLGCVANPSGGPCPRSKLSFINSQGQKVIDDPSGQFYGIIQKRWKTVGDPIMLVSHNLKNHSNNLFFEVLDKDSTLLDSGIFPVPLGYFSVNREDILAGNNPKRVVMWLISACGATSTHQLELVP